MKKALYKPQMDSVDISVNIYANESCNRSPNRVCIDYSCTDSSCDGSAEWTVFLNDTCVNITCVNDHC
jgi:hypothetical protein